MARLWILEDETMTNDFPLGVSNAFMEGKTATVSVRKGTLLLIHEKMRGIM
ncbi:MAG: hypothetical protein IJR00_01690 [Lachnospiraceae bacterium]|nr:hypothetical protein [Lachnospiraceae bacterium]